MVNAFKFLASVILNNLTWTANTCATVEEAQQRLHVLRVLGRDKINTELLLAFCCAAIKGVLTQGISVWYAGSSAAVKKVSQGVIVAAQNK